MFFLVQFDSKQKGIRTWMPFTTPRAMDSTCRQKYRVAICNDLGPTHCQRQGAILGIGNCRSNIPNFFPVRCGVINPDLDVTPSTYHWCWTDYRDEMRRGIVIPAPTSLFQARKQALTIPNHRKRRQGKISDWPERLFRCPG
jgi:hypothetical protein